jgi:hypothetical protein
MIPPGKAIERNSIQGIADECLNIESPMICGQSSAD